MVNAFGPGRASAFPYISTLGLFVFFVFPAILLFPFVRHRIAGQVAIVFYSIGIVATVVSAILSPSFSLKEYSAVGVTYGNLVLLMVLLWLRVHDMRPKLETRNLPS